MIGAEDSCFSKSCFPSPVYVDPAGHSRGWEASGKNERKQLRSHVLMWPRQHGQCRPPRAAQAAAHQDAPAPWTNKFMEAGEKGPRPGHDQGPTTCLPHVGVVSKWGPVLSLRALECPRLRMETWAWEVGRLPRQPTDRLLISGPAPCPRLLVWFSHT